MIQSINSSRGTRTQWASRRAQLGRGVGIGALVLGLQFTAAAAMAGQSCAPFVPTPDSVARSLGLAGQVNDALEQSGAEVALVARVGQNLSRWHLRYSHMAFVWRDHPAGRWSVIHELNECASDRSNLYLQGLGDFFLDDMYQYQALMIIPGPELQRRIVDELKSSDLEGLHEPHYNVVAYPFSTEYQNSNGWLIEVLAASLAPADSIHDRGAAQAYLAAHGFRPTTLEIPALDRLGAEVTRANTSFADHPLGRRLAGEIDCVTVDSVARFVGRSDPAARFVEISGALPH